MKLSSPLWLSAVVGVTFVSNMAEVVQAAETYNIDWSVPSDGQPLPTMHVLLGDTVIFNYGPEQAYDVFIHPNKVCEMPVDRVRVKGYEGPGVYTFTETGQHFFASDVGGQCEMGLYIRIFAYEKECERLVAEGTISSCDGFTDDDEGGSGSEGEGTTDSGSETDGGTTGGDSSAGLRSTVGIVAGAITAYVTALLLTSH